MAEMEGVTGRPTTGVEEEWFALLITVEDFVKLSVKVNLEYCEMKV